MQNDLVFLSGANCVPGSRSITLFAWTVGFESQGLSSRLHLDISLI